MKILKKSIYKEFLKLIPIFEKSKPTHSHSNYSWFTSEKGSFEVVIYPLDKEWEPLQYIMPQIGIGKLTLPSKNLSIRLKVCTT